MTRIARNFPVPGMLQSERKQKTKSLTNVDANRQGQYVAALYIRLSKENSGADTPNCVNNQKGLLEKYVSERPEFSVFETYIDNGFSGINFERPAFKRMMDDIRTHQVNCIIIKDFSRFGRNYLELGNYLEKILPFLNVRLISITDNYDSLHSGCDDTMISLKNVINDLYARDISRKVSSALEVKKQMGNYGGGLAPFGYQKSKAVRGRFEIDKEAAKVVTYIFQLRSQGYGYCSIVRKLNEQGIKSPGAYRYDKELIKDEARKCILWKRYAVEDMLKDEVYIGNMVRGKTRSALYKGERRHHVSRDEWVVIKGTHEPVISQELFDAVQVINKERESAHKFNRNKEKVQNRKENLFVGKS